MIHKSVKVLPFDRNKLFTYIQLRQVEVEWVWWQMAVIVDVEVEVRGGGVEHCLSGVEQGTRRRRGDDGATTLHHFVLASLRASTWHHLQRYNLRTERHVELALARANTIILLQHDFPTRQNLWLKPMVRAIASTAV